MKQLFLLALLFVGMDLNAQANKALSYVDAMQKKYKAIPSFSANFSYQLEGSSWMNGSILVKGNKFRLKTGGQEIFNNGKEIATYIKEINEVNLNVVDPSDNDINPAKIYSFDKKSYKINLVSDQGSLAVLELAPNNKNANMQKITVKIAKASKEVKEWVITNKSGKKQWFKVTKFAAVNTDDKSFNFDKKLFPGVEVNDLR